MVRPLRIEYAGALYHVTSRGDRREDIFLDDEDRRLWLELFGGVCVRFNWRCHAWCLMDNHYHVLVETIEGNLSKGMRQLNGVYTQRSNFRHNRVGHVFQGRYKAILVDKNDYLLELARYVVLNPIRARMIKDLSEWSWSSYLAMIGKESAPEWLETDWLLGCFGTKRKTIIARYIDFVREGVGLPSVWEQMDHPNCLGSESFVEGIRDRFGKKGQDDLIEVSRMQRCPLAMPLDWYEKQYTDRKQGMLEAFASGDYTMKQIACRFGVHYSTVSRAVKKSEYMRDCKT